MTVYVDNMRAPLGLMKMCHMIADTEAELHAMADRIGVARRWYQGDHYDISLSKRALAVEHGAREISVRQLGAMAVNRRCGWPMGTPETTEAIAKVRRAALSMKALSVRQPWAWAILHLGKDIENRSWPTHYRGDFLLHAAMTYDTDGHHYLQRMFGIRLPSMREMPGGGIVGIVRLVDCVTLSTSGWFNGPYGFVLADPRPTPFIQCRGALGFFDVAPPNDRSVDH